MKTSNWWLYIGIFLCATGFGVVVGAIFIFYWGIKTLQESKTCNSYTENNYTNIIECDPDDNSDNNAAVPREYISKDALEEGR